MRIKDDFSEVVRPCGGKGIFQWGFAGKGEVVLAKVNFSGVVWAKTNFNGVVQTKTYFTGFVWAKAVFSGVVWTNSPKTINSQPARLIASWTFVLCCTTGD